MADFGYGPEAAGRLWIRKFGLKLLGDSLPIGNLGFFSCGSRVRAGVMSHRL